MLPIRRRRISPTGASSCATWCSRLPSKQRTAIVLRYVADLPDDEIAAVLGCRRSTVRSLVARGLATIRSEVNA